MPPKNPSCPMTTHRGLVPGTRLEYFTRITLAAFIGMLSPWSEVSATPRRGENPQQDTTHEKTRRSSKERLAQTPPQLAELIGTLRNPFMPPPSSDETQDPIHPLTTTELEQLRLTAIIRDQNGALKGSIETASGRGFIVTKGSQLGRNRGSITAISAEGITVTEPADPTTDRESRTIELSIRGSREDWQIRHARARNRSTAIDEQLTIEGM